jgi:DNA-binding transcriptional LysR family regulator
VPINPELRLIRYFVAVGEHGNVTRAAEDLHISQPSLSAAIKQLEAQLGVDLLERQGRGVTLTAAGSLLFERGRELVEHFDSVLAEVSRRGDAPAGQLRLGLSPTARYAVVPALLAVCASEAPAAMIYTSEHTTGALLRDVAQGRLDLAVTFCADADHADGLQMLLLRDEPAVVHLPDDHRLAGRTSVTLADLADETILIAASPASSGFTKVVTAAFAEAGITPHTLADPYPDLGQQAVRERLGVVIYARSAFPADLDGSVFVRIEPRMTVPFHLVWRARTRSAALDAVVAAARGLAHRWADATDPLVPGSQLTAP